MHVASSSAYTYVKEVEVLIESKPCFWSETHLDQLAELQLQSTIYLLPEGRNLVDYIGVNKFDKWVRVVDKHFKLDLHQLSTFIPFMILCQLQARYFDSYHAEPLDRYLWNYAKHQGKMVDGIESVEFQSSVLSRITLDAQFKMLKDFISNPNKFKIQIGKLEKLYEKQDIGNLYKSTRKKLGLQRRLLLADRNEVMASKIMSNIDIPSVYTFGAAHLAGHTGVLALLKHKGADVKRYRN